MPWYERDYYSQPPTTHHHNFADMFKGRSMVFWLIAINCAVFILELILGGASRIPDWAQPIVIGNFNVSQTFVHYQLWRLITYQFLHAGFFHILFNMIVLYFFGPMLEQWLGSKRFVAFYLLCGVSGAIVMSALAYIPGLLAAGPNAELIGASGAIFGVLVADAYVFPRQRVQLIFPPIAMSLRTLALALLGLAIFEILIGAQNAGGEACHLGGALLGFILIKNLYLIGWADRVKLPGKKNISPRPASRRNSASYANNATNSFARFSAKLKQANKKRQEHLDKQEEDEVDRILIKVKRQGLQSLTKKEKKTLNRATEKLNKN